METFFWVRAKVGRTTYSYGPYLLFQTAAIIMIEHLDALVEAEGTSKTIEARYITEEALCNSEWSLINTKTKEIE